MAAGAVVYAADHHAHGRSEGEPALVTDGDVLVDDLATVVGTARREHPGRPVVMVAHSLGALIAVRLVQRGLAELDALVLSGPVIGPNPEIATLLELDPMPEVPIDPAVLSRDLSVGEAYVADPLVYSGPFKRETLESLFAAIDLVGAGPDLGELPTLWIHGEHDGLVPLATVQPVIERIRGSRTEEKVYPEARHEIFNETNREEVLDDVVEFVHRSLS